MSAGFLDRLHKNSKAIKREYRIDASKEPLSRYRNLVRLVDEDGRDYIEMLTDEDMYVPESPDDIIHEVKPGEEGRLDLISYKYYNTPGLYWVICYANNIDDPMDVKAGTILRIPSWTTLYGYGGILSS